MNKKIRRIIQYLKIIGLKGLTYIIAAGLSKTSFSLIKTLADYKHPIRLRIPSSDVPTFRQVFLDQEYDFLVDSQPDVIVDAGANIGLASIYFSNKYPEARVIAIEPEKSNFEILKENTAFYPNIEPVHAALWNKNERINLIDPGLGKWGFMTETKNSSFGIPGNTCHTVQAVTVDKVMHDHNLDRINILKMDIEGAEKEVFGDSSSWLQKVDCLIVELHESMKPGCNRSFYLGSNGFENEWSQGENVYLSRHNRLGRPRAS